TEESTPPDIAATTRVSRGGFGMPRELSVAGRRLRAGRAAAAWVMSLLPLGSRPRAMADIYGARVRGARRPTTSIQLEVLFVVELQGRVLFVLLQDAIPDDEQVHLRAHEAAEGVFRRVDDRL